MKKKLAPLPIHNNTVAILYISGLISVGLISLAASIWYVLLQ